jgi:hypothetical protein
MGGEVGDGVTGVPWGRGVEVFAEEELLRMHGVSAVCSVHVLVHLQHMT